MKAREMGDLERIEEVLRLSRSAVWEVDRRGVYTYASASHEALLGYRPEELVGRRTIHDFYPADVPGELRAALFEDWIGAGEEFTDLEVPLVAKSGEIVWVTSHGKPIFDDGGHLAGFRGADTDISARKRTETEVRRTNERMQVAARVGGIGFWEHDCPSGVEVWDEGMLRIYGIGREGFAGTVEAWLRLVHPQDRDTVESALARSRDGDGAAECGFRIVRPDGGVRHIASQWMVARDAAGRPLRMTGINQDVTELRAGEALLRSLVEFAPVPIAFTRPAQPGIQMNRAFTEAYGWTSADVPTVEAWFEKIYQGEDYRREVLARWEPMVERARRTDGRIPPAEYRLTAKDGSVREVELSAVVFGEVIFGTFLDQTERKRVLRELEEGESSLRGLVENAPIGIVRMQLDTGSLWMNAAFTEMLGYTGGDLPDFSTWLERAYPDPGRRERLLAEWMEVLDRARAGDGRLEASEARVVAKDGTAHEMQFSGIVVGKEVFCLWIDLTARNRAERLLRERQEQLARVGRVSTLGQLAASLAHELEQPLGAILNNAEAASLLLRGASPDLGELRAIMDDILADDRRAGAVLDRIRGMVRQRRFEPQAVPVEPLLREVERLLRPLAAPLGIRVEISLAPGASTVVGDPVLLQQALLNLGLNAVEAIGKRADGLVEIQAGNPDPGWIGIRLRDNGGGVPPSEYDTLFEPFFTTKPNGLGMGLPLVRSIVDEHGGELLVDNQPGRGLEVVLRLPARMP